MGPIVFTSSLFLAFTAFYFLQLKRKKSAVDSTHDILKKYQVFIDLALAQGKTSRIERLKSNSLSIRTSSLKNASLFALTEVDQRIIIVWTWSDRNFGRRGKEWSFPDNYDQKKMFDEVVEDVLAYQMQHHQYQYK